MSTEETKPPSVHHVVISVACENWFGSDIGKNWSVAVYDCGGDADGRAYELVVYGAGKLVTEQLSLRCAEYAVSLALEIAVALNLGKFDVGGDIRDQITCALVRAGQSAARWVGDA
jgi:hypothetical protein